jgi:preprotein translocase subunit SecA
MKRRGSPTSGIASGPYPERRDPTSKRSHGSAVMQVARAIPGAERRSHSSFLARVHEQDERLRNLSAAAFQTHIREVRARLASSGFQNYGNAAGFALVREATRRELGIAHYDTQLIAGNIMLGNRLAEMATGEGKTLTAALTAATAALAGMPVHVITANDYLVDRDAQVVGPVYRALGLSVGAVTQKMEQTERRSAYACDITYCTAKELVFDYLRDRLIRRDVSSDLHERVRRLDGAQEAQSGLLLRGLWMALIDEADSILIDEARTPLVLSQSRVNAQQVNYLRQSLGLADALKDGVDYRLLPTESRAELLPAGRQRIDQHAEQLGGLWRDGRHREEVITMALAARHIFLRDQHYIVRNDEVIMVDQNTGRLAPGRVWSRGLHQLIEAKEACKPTGDQETIAQITYQRFFPRYLRLGGMSGTLQEASAELNSAYGLSIERVPLRKPSRRIYLPQRVFVTRAEKWAAVVARVEKLSNRGRPVLIGTDSVADSDMLSRLLREKGLQHAVLNARDDSEEAKVVARAGQPGQITVTTNMAGRGTDIPLAPAVVASGGLHVICCQQNASARIDRQLQGRCARQGDPGSVETILSLQDELIARFWPLRVRRAVAWCVRTGRHAPVWLGRLAAHLPQIAEERRQRLERKTLSEVDDRAERRLSFAGRGE